LWFAIFGVYNAKFWNGADFMAMMASIAGLKDTYVQLKTRMDKAVEDFRKAMAATRTGRASVHMLDGVTVDAYGAQMPLNQVAQVHAPEAQLITVQPFDPSQFAAEIWD
jgi:ribosome recycling factor